MDLFKSQLERIQKQLSALTPSQKMLTASMVAIMVMTLVWWGATPANQRWRRCFHSPFPPMSCRASKWRWKAKASSM